MKTITLIAFLLLVVWPIEGIAGGGDNYFFVGGGFGLENIDNHDLDHENKIHHESRDEFEDGWFARLGYGRQVRHWLGLEAYYEFAAFEMVSFPKNNDDGADGEFDIDIHNFNLAVKVFLFNEKNSLRPFLTLGVGPMLVEHEVEGEDSKEELGISWIGEAGVNWRFSDDWSAECFAGFRDGLLDTDSYEYGVFGALLKFHF